MQDFGICAQYITTKRRKSSKNNSDRICGEENQMKNKLRWLVFAVALVLQVAYATAGLACRGTFHQPETPEALR